MISNANLAALQKAGSTLHEAKTSLDLALQGASRVFVISIAQSPFGPESDQAVSDLRAIAQMSKELHVMEEKMVTLFKSASQLSRTNDNYVFALPAPVQAVMAKRGRKPKSAQADAATDVVEKPSTKLKKFNRPGGTGNKKPEPNKPAKAIRVTTNDKKVEKFLKEVLNKKSWTAVTHAQVNEGSGVPLGSVGSALSRAKVRGVVVENTNGDLKLG